MPEIVINDNDRRKQYTASGGQTVFAYDFPIFDDDHVVVKRTRAGTTTTLTKTTDYTVSGVEVETGGNITLTSGATAGDVMTLYSDVPVERTSDFTEAGDFLAVTLNREFDLQTIMIQQTERDLTRTMSLAIEDSSTDLTLPLAADRANKYLAFDSNGDPVPLLIGDVQVQDSVGTYVGTVSGTANAIVLTPSPAIASYTAGNTFTFKASGTNTTAVTVNISGVGAQALTKDGAVALVAGDIQSGALITIVCETATRFQLQTKNAVAANITTGNIATANITTGNTTTGNVTTTNITTGNIGALNVSGLATLTGGQLKFPATQVPSGDVNTLDDYEEGTWTPSLGGNTVYTSQVGSYIKIGRLVTLDFSVFVSTIGTGSTTAIAGLPFPVYIASGFTYGGSVSYWSSLATPVYFIALEVSAGTQNILLRGVTASAANISTSTDIFGNSAIIHGHAHYLTTA